MIGISTFCTACTNSSPMPGHWNTVSVMIANAMTEPNCSPATVMTGTSVFFSAWPKWTARVGQAAGAGEADVVGAQHLQHLGAHQPHDQRHLEQAERDRRHDQRLQAGDREQAGRPPADPDDVAAAERRQPAQRHREQVDQQDADQEGRQRDADQRHRLEYLASSGVALERANRRPSGCRRPSPGWWRRSRAPASPASAPSAGSRPAGGTDRRRRT